MNRNRQTLNVHRLPRDVAEAELGGCVVIVIDLLRASSTICQAIASGASEVVPFLEVEETLTAAEKAGRSQVVLGGERNGGKIPGFDVGNSPSEYTAERVGGRRVFFTTTNGTRALHHARKARRILVGAFVNLSAVVASVKDAPLVEILCAGTGGKETREDILAAGAIAHRLTDGKDNSAKLNDTAKSALGQWQAVIDAAEAGNRALAEQVAIELRDTQGGRNLLGIGLDRDLVDCAQIDRLNVVPRLDVTRWRITG
jgi:2-phosphosulfolactate phosphatase